MDSMKEFDVAATASVKLSVLSLDRASDPVPPIPSAMNSVMVAIKIALASASIEAVICPIMSAFCDG